MCGFLIDLILRNFCFELKILTVTSKACTKTFFENNIDIFISFILNINAKKKRIHDRIAKSDKKINPKIINIGK